MNILVTNDDGIRAEGIRNLAKALTRLGDVYVCAPASEKSACGHGITIYGPIGVEEQPFAGAKKAYAIEGTPADCVKIGLNLLEKEGVDIDMVFSGINHGGNLGTDTLYSGTVSAAVEGSLCGKPSVAVSIDAREPRYFEASCELAVLAGRSAFGRIDGRTVLNINLPDSPKEKLRGVRVTRLGVREYAEWFREEPIRDGRKRYSYSGRPLFSENLQDDIDIAAVQDGYASITPLHYDLTDHHLIETVKSWGLEEDRSSELSALQRTERTGS